MAQATEESALEWKLVFGTDAGNPVLIDAVDKMNDRLGKSPDMKQAGFGRGDIHLRKDPREHCIVFESTSGKPIPRSIVEALRDYATETAKGSQAVLMRGELVKGKSEEPEEQNVPALTYEQLESQYKALGIEVTRLRNQKDALEELLGKQATEIYHLKRRLGEAETKQKDPAVIAYESLRGMQSNRGLVEEVDRWFAGIANVFDAALSNEDGSRIATVLQSIKAAQKAYKMLDDVFFTIEEKSALSKLTGGDVIKTRELLNKIASLSDMHERMQELEKKFEEVQDGLDVIEAAKQGTLADALGATKSIPSFIVRTLAKVDLADLKKQLEELSAQMEELKLLGTVKTGWERTKSYANLKAPKQLTMCVVVSLSPGTQPVIDIPHAETTLSRYLSNEIIGYAAAGQESMEKGIRLLKTNLSEIDINLVYRLLISG